MKHPKAQLPDYALGLLDPDEAAAVEAHLKECEACREEVRQFDNVLTDWVDALPEVAPPEGAKARLMSRIKGEARAETPETTEQAGGLSEARDSDNADFVQDGERVALLPAPSIPAAPRQAAPSTSLPSTSLPKVIQDRPPRLPRWLVAACAACLVLAGAGLFQGYRTQLALEQVRAEQDLLTRFLTAPNVQSVTLYDEADARLGAALTRPGDALFVLAEPPPAGRVYQAWGHTSDDWSPQSGEQLTSLEVSQGTVFQVSTEGFASLYLSVEPPGGSPQPTDPLSSVPLSGDQAASPIEVSSPEDGATLSADSTVVRGNVGSEVRELRYRLNDQGFTTAPFSSGRFMFTVSGLERGENRLEVQATTASDEVVTDSLTLNYAPSE